MRILKKIAFIVIVRVIKFLSTTGEKNFVFIMFIITFRFQSLSNNNTTKVASPLLT